MAVIIPALNEERALPTVLAEIPATLSPRVVVVDNGSTDATAEVARAAGVEVVSQRVRGYGRACLSGLAALSGDPPDIVVFLDADHSDYPQDLVDILAPVLAGEADLVCGSRVQQVEAGALAPQVRWGNRLATWMIEKLHGHSYRDMGPFRAVRWRALEQLGMCDPTYGWNAEMQVKAVQHGLRVAEVSVRYRARVGRSKISGTIKGTVMAGSLIIWTIIALRFFPARQSRRADAPG